MQAKWQNAHSSIRIMVKTSYLVAVKKFWVFCKDHHRMEAVVADDHINTRMRDVGDNPLPKIRNQEIQGKQQEIIFL